MKLLPAYIVGRKRHVQGISDAAAGGQALLWSVLCSGPAGGSNLHVVLHLVVVVVVAAGPEMLQSRRSTSADAGSAAPFGCSTAACCSGCRMAWLLPLSRGVAVVVGARVAAEVELSNWCCWVCALLCRGASGEWGIHPCQNGCRAGNTRQQRRWNNFYLLVANGCSHWLCSW
jgi:hypothetical protein